MTSKHIDEIIVQWRQWGLVSARRKLMHADQAANVAWWGLFAHRDSLFLVSQLSGVEWIKVEARLKQLTTKPQPITVGTVASRPETSGSHVAADKGIKAICRAAGIEPPLPGLMRM